MVDYVDCFEVARSVAALLNQLCFPLHHNVFCSIKHSEQMIIMIEVLRLLYPERGILPRRHGWN
jgi:hypothetical protein